MSVSSLPQDLVSSSACLDCIPKQARRSVLTYLLCQWATKSAPSNPNLIPPGAAYGGFVPSQYCLRNPGPMIVGATYQFTNNDPTYSLTFFTYLGLEPKHDFGVTPPGITFKFVTTGDGFCISNVNYLTDPLVLATLVYVSGP